MVKIMQYCKSNGINRIINDNITENEAINFINDLISEFEKQETEKLRRKGSLPSNGFYSKHYFYYIITQ